MAILGWAPVFVSVPRRAGRGSEAIAMGWSAPAQWSRGWATLNHPSSSGCGGGQFAPLADREYL